MLLTALQAEAPAAPAAETEEAGTHFWKAVKLAQEGKFDEARKALDQARKVHDQERFRRCARPRTPSAIRPKTSFWSAVTS